jgi:Tol biopolymer transport system component
MRCGRQRLQGQENDHTARSRRRRYRFKEDEIGISTAAANIFMYSTSSAKRGLNHSGDYDEGPAWSPDGKQIAFTSNCSTPTQTGRLIATSGSSPLTTLTKAHTSRR